MNQQEPENIRKPSMQQITQGLTYKEKGNEYFKQKNYQQALKMYNLAIQKDPTSSIYYSNKARCLHNMNKFQQALQAAQYGIKIDEKNIKAHYLAAQSLVKISEETKDKKKIQIAIQSLKRSLTLCPSQGKGQFQRNFVDKIYKAKKKLWLIQNQEENQKKKAVRKYLIHLVQTDNTLDQKTKDQFNQQILKLVQSERINIFSKIPSALICPITKMLLKEPVCNQYGHSYSKQDYVKYLTQNSGKDPITNKPVKNRAIMYTNINVKKAVELFLQQNPWAYQKLQIV